MKKFFSELLKMVVAGVLMLGLAFSLGTLVVSAGCMIVYMTVANQQFIWLAGIVFGVLWMAYSIVTIFLWLYCLVLRRKLAEMKAKFPPRGLDEIWDDYYLDRRLEHEPDLERPPAPEDLPEPRDDEPKPKPKPKPKAKK